MKLLRENPNEKILIVFILAGHGMQMAGKQVVLLNEFNRGTAFYKFWGIEGQIRATAELFPNSYQIGIFACCRQIYLQSRDAGCLPGPEKQARAAFEKMEEARREAE